MLQVIEEIRLAERARHHQKTELEELERNRYTLRSFKETSEHEMTVIDHKIKEATKCLRKLDVRLIDACSNVQQQEVLAKIAEDDAHRRKRFYGFVFQIWMHVVCWGVMAAIAFRPNITFPTPSHDAEF